MKIKQEKRGEVLIVYLEGETKFIDSDEELSEKIKKIKKSGVERVVFDLSKLNSINSAGLGIMINLMIYLDKKENGVFKIGGVSEVMRKRLKKTHLDTVFEIYDSVDKALESFN